MIGGLEATQTAMRLHKNENLSGFGAAYFGFVRFLNNMGNGFVGVEPFHEPMDFARKDGQSWTWRDPGSGLPKGSLLAVASTGLTLMVFDWVASKFAGGRSVKIPMTNYNAIGGS